MRLAVIIITRNRATVFPAPSSPALAQKFAQKAVWVSDDASEDATPRLAEGYPSGWFRGDTRPGIPSARARRLQLSEAENVCSLDDGAWFLEMDALETAGRFLEGCPGVAGPGFDIVSPEREDRRKRGAPRPSHTFPGCGHVLRVSAAREVGGFEEFPGFYGCEEKDLAIRLLDAGHEIMTLTGVHVWHDKTAMGRNPREMHTSGVCNDFAWVVRRYPVPDLCWALPFKILSHLRFSCRVGSPGACIEGIMMFLKAAPRLFAARNPVRRKTLREFLHRASAGPKAHDRQAWPTERDMPRR